MFLQNKIHLNENLFNEDLIRLRVSDLDIQDITLLSEEEADQILEKYMKFDDWWWLKSPGCYQDYVAYVNYFGAIYSRGCIVDYDNSSVRPTLMVLNLKDFNLPLYSEIELDNGTIWLVISDNMLLCNDESFGKHRFDKKSNDYETSEIKQYIHDKAKELGFNFGARNVNHKNKKKLVIFDETLA